jgi:hypothetical protein
MPWCAAANPSPRMTDTQEPQPLSPRQGMGAGGLVGSFPGPVGWWVTWHRRQPGRGEGPRGIDPQGNRHQGAGGPKGGSRPAND